MFARGFVLHLSGYLRVRIHEVVDLDLPVDQFREQAVLTFEIRLSSSLWISTEHGRAQREEVRQSEETQDRYQAEEGARLEHRFPQPFAAAMCTLGGLLQAFSFQPSDIGLATFLCFILCAKCG